MSPPQRAAVPAAYATVVTLFMAWGFITSNNDPLIAAVRGIYDLGYTEALLTQFAFFIAYGLVSLPAAALLARLGSVNMVLVALGVMVLACLVAVLATRADSYAVMLGALFVMASGITALQVAANPLAAGLGDPARSHFRLTFAQAFNSLGVVLGVHFGAGLMLDEALFTAGGDAGAGTRPAALAAIGHAYLLIGGALVLLMLFFALSRRRLAEAETPAAEAPGSVLAALSDPWALAGCIAIFVYVGAEVTIASLMINFLNSPEVLGLPLQTAGVWLANFYWGGALLGRFVGSSLLIRFPAPILLGGAAAVAALLCAVVMLASGPLAAAAALSVGLFNAIMFPTIFSLTLERTRAPVPAVSGLLCTAIVGGAIVPLLAGLLADSATLSLAFAVPLVCYLVILRFARAAGRHSALRAAPTSAH